MKGISVQAAILIVVSLLGVAVFYVVLEKIDHRRGVAEAERRVAELTDRFDQRLEIVQSFAQRLQYESGITTDVFLQIAIGTLQDSSFVAAEWLPRITPDKRELFQHRIRKDLHDSTTSLRTANSKNAIAAEEVVFPVRFSTQKDNALLGVYRKGTSALHAAVSDPNEVAMSCELLVLAAHETISVTTVFCAVPLANLDRRELRGVVAVHFKGMFAPRWENTVYDRTEIAVYKNVSDKQVLVAGSDVQTRKTLHISNVDRSDHRYRFEVAESSRVVAKRARLSLFGILLGPFFVCSRLRFFWQRVANSLESKNRLLTDEVCEQAEVQQTLRSLLAIRDQERRLVANEIHDGFIQEVISAQMFLEALVAKMDDGDETAKELLENARALVELSINEGRQLVNELKPRAVDQYGFIPALQRLVASQNERHGMSITLRYPPGELVIDIQCERTLYRVAQEALANIRRHSGAKEGVVCVHVDAKWVMLDVTDQGCGFEMATEDDGFGLRGIRERAEIYGGEAVIKSVPGDGTALTVRLPVDACTHPSAQAMARGSGELPLDVK